MCIGGDDLKSLKEVCKLVGVSRSYVQRLAYKGKIEDGTREPYLMPPTEVRGSGERWYYDDEAVERLWMIVLLHKELNYKLSEVERMLDDENFDRRACLGEQIDALTEKRDRLNKLIIVAEMMMTSGLAPQQIVDTSELSVAEFVEEVARMVKKVSPSTQKKIKDAMGDKAFNAAFRNVAVLRNIGVEADDDKVLQEVRNMASAFETHIGKGGLEALRRLGEMFVASGAVSAHLAEHMGKNVPKYVGESILAFYNKTKEEKTHE